MSRNTLVVAGLALILAIGALVLQFVLPSGGESGTAGLDALRAEVNELRQTNASGSMKLAYMDAEDAFGVFVVAVGDLRQQITNKSNEMLALAQEHQQGLIADDDYNRQLAVLQAELLDARVTTAAGTLDRMIASDEFGDLLSSLVTLRGEAQGLIDQVNDLVSTIRVGSIDAADFNGRLNALTAAFENFDNYVTSAATTKLVQATQLVANEYGYDIVIRKKDVIMYRNPVTIDDITELVKAEIEGYL